MAAFPITCHDKFRQINLSLDKVSSDWLLGLQPNLCSLLCLRELALEVTFKRWVAIRSRTVMFSEEVSDALEKFIHIHQLQCALVDGHKDEAQAL